MGAALSAGAVLGRAVFPGSAQTSLAAQAAQTGAGEVDAVVFGQDFGQVVVVVVPVDCSIRARILWRVAWGMRRGEGRPRLP